MDISFFGGVGTVTGSKYLLEANHRRVLVDCGLFQGLKQLRLRNWAPLPFEPKSVDSVVLTHAHIDHSGYLPRLIRNGFKGPVYCTQSTADLCGILLPDAGHLAERDAEMANRQGFSKHHPALPLFTEADAREALKQLTPVPWGTTQPLGKGLKVTFQSAGHILGAAALRLASSKGTLLFSGDLGRPGDPIMKIPAPIGSTDYLIVESTYGDRRHDPEDPGEALAAVINRTASRGGSVLIPAFAVGRAQTLLYHLWKLKDAHKIPDLPVFLDSPMAQDFGDLFRQHRKDHRLTVGECRAVCGTARYTRTPEESQAIARSKVPAVIISASGMATGGRVLHHLKVIAPDRVNTILFAGFQAAGTRGAAMIAGARQIKIHGGYVAVNADVQNLDMLSAHADSEEILSWLGTATKSPERTFITHGEPVAADSLRHRIEEELHWDCIVPMYGDKETIRL
jgi:metallo-beta-lactamase family protein